MHGWLKWWPLLAIILLAFLSVFLLVDLVAGSILPSASKGINPDCIAFCGSDESEVRSNLGALGDIVGGLLNPVLTFISIILLIITINLTRETLDQARQQNRQSELQIKINKDALDLNREEMKLARIEFEGSRVAHEDASDTLRLQRQEQMFFNLYESFADLCVSLSTPGGIANYGNNHPVQHIFQTTNKSSNPELYIKTLPVARPEIHRLIKQLIMLCDIAHDHSDLMQIIKDTFIPELKIVILIVAYHSEGFDGAKTKRLITGDGLLEGEAINIRGYGGHLKVLIDRSAEALGVETTTS